jgi:hypothetical protein
MHQRFDRDFSCSLYALAFGSFGTSDNIDICSAEEPAARQLNYNTDDQTPLIKSDVRTCAISKHTFGNI